MIVIGAKPKTENPCGAQADKGAKKSEPKKDSAKKSK